ncbi:MAG: SDR family NAD(P)-dependent oxidoreductase [Deltaproteobacteria bacterium]|nr:SDR family NAD(P)-dependent oxidoreductase [Deltaproteobacteria bacterium]
MQLSELKVIVTGGGSGMGKHFCERFCAEGASVVAFDVDAAGLEKLVNDCGSCTGQLHTQVVDVTDEAQVVDAVKLAGQTLGGLNALINNAGIFRDGMLVKVDKKTGDVQRMSLEKWQSVIDVDLTGPFLMAREVAAYMIENKTAPGVIVNMSSVSRAGNPGQSNYSAAKAGLVADTKLWAEELARYQIRVGAIAPGFVRTPILDGMRPEVLERMLTGVPLRRLGEPEEIFRGIRFIVECDYFTGRCIDIDGGVRM